MRMATDAPASKVNASTIAAATTTVLLYLLKTYVIGDGPALPELVELALGILITGAVTGGATFLAGYFTPPASQDKIVPDAAPRPPGIPHA